MSRNDVIRPDWQVMRSRWTLQMQRILNFSNFDLTWKIPAAQLQLTNGPKPHLWLFLELGSTNPTSAMEAEICFSILQLLSCLPWTTSKTCCHDARAAKSNNKKPDTVSLGFPPLTHPMQSGPCEDPWSLQPQGEAKKTPEGGDGT